VIPLAAFLSIAFAFALTAGAILYLAITLPRRVMRLLFDEQTKTAHALIEKTALREAIGVEVSGVVYELRAYRDESALLAEWSPEEISRIDASAARRNLTRVQMIAHLVRRTLAEDAQSAFPLQAGKGNPS
jgi:hypothetical protein